MASKFSPRMRIQQALQDYEPGNEVKSKVRMGIKAKEFKINHNLATTGVSKHQHKNAFKYFIQYKESMSSEVEMMPYQFKKRNGEIVETTVGQYVNGKIRGLEALSEKISNTNIGFDRHVKKRVKEMQMEEQSLGYGYQREKEQDSIGFND